MCYKTDRLCGQSLQSVLRGQLCKTSIWSTCPPKADWNRFMKEASPTCTDPDKPISRSGSGAGAHVGKPEKGSGYEHKNGYINCLYAKWNCCHVVAYCCMLLQKADGACLS